jgi:hypothetical protein
VWSQTNNFHSLYLNFHTCKLTNVFKQRLLRQQYVQTVLNLVCILSCWLVTIVLWYVRDCLWVVFLQSPSTSAYIESTEASHAYRMKISKHKSFFVYNYPIWKIKSTSGTSWLTNVSKRKNTFCIENHVRRVPKLHSHMEQMRFFHGRSDSVFSDFWIPNIQEYLGPSQTYISWIKIFSSPKNPLTIQQRWLQNKTNGIILPQRCCIKIYMYIYQSSWERLDICITERRYSTVV